MNAKGIANINFKVVSTSRKGKQIIQGNLTITSKRTKFNQQRGILAKVNFTWIQRSQNIGVTRPRAKLGPNTNIRGDGTFSKVKRDLVAQVYHQNFLL